MVYSKYINRYPHKGVPGFLSTEAGYTLILYKKMFVDLQYLLLFLTNSWLIIQNKANMKTKIKQANFLIA
jgi:hypothetical protein